MIGAADLVAMQQAVGGVSGRYLPKVGDGVNIPVVVVLETPTSPAGPAGVGMVGLDLSAEWVLQDLPAFDRGDRLQVQDGPFAGVYAIRNRHPSHALGMEVARLGARE